MVKVFLERFMQKVVLNFTILKMFLLIWLRFSFSLFAALAQVYHNISCFRVRGFVTREVLKLNLSQSKRTFLFYKYLLQVPYRLRNLENLENGPFFQNPNSVGNQGFNQKLKVGG